MKGSFVSVILPLPPEQYFTYAVPSYFNDKVEVGKRVIVQFGKQKIYTGIIAEVLNENPGEYDAKDILDVIDEFPVVLPSQLGLWKWISQYYICSEGEVMAASLPAVMKLQSETMVALNDEDELGTRILSDDEQLLIERLRKEKSISVHDLSALLGKRNSISLINELIDSGLLVPNEEVRNKYKEPLIDMIALTKQSEDNEFMKQLVDSIEKRAPKQFLLLMTFMNIVRDGSAVEVNKKILLKKSGSSHAVLNQLIAKKVFQIVQRKEQELNVGRKSINLADLAPNQEVAFESIKSGFKKDKVVLLHGVTSSGKTEIYSKLISEMIKANKQVLYLLPEIALTAQIIQRLKRMFGDSLVVYHSRHNQRERATVYLKILSDGNDGDYKYPIIIGARSAVFLPFKDLGLIIVDEEHESSYKQFDPAPRYHARDTAILLGEKMNANVVLGSATPSLESYRNAVESKYELVELKGRFGGIQPPELTLIDLAESYRRRLVKSHFSNVLLDEIKDTVGRGEQVILFQNRRGFAPVLECGNCGWIPHCINCDVSLTYHKRSNKMQCHYCGYNVIPQINCEECKSHNVKMKGLGTERIEDNVLSFFPDMKVERLDLDTSSSKSSFHRILTSFESGEIDVLVGTQMITKGLDFNNVGLVGVLNADNLINFPDFRASERSFQLLAQVAGRAGRRQKRGKVFVQAFNINHPILKFLSRYDYRSFYNYESHERKLYNYPPYFRLIEFRLKHRNEMGVEELSKLFGQSLKNVFGKRILGPVIPAVSRVRNLYIRNVTMKVEKDYSNVAVKNEIHKIIENFRKTPKNRQLFIQVDVDPF